jgi:hypothetical protein
MNDLLFATADTKKPGRENPIRASFISTRIYATT